MPESSTDFSYRPGILLLAAGASRRFDGIKQLATLHIEGSETDGIEGKAMLSLALQNLSELPAEGRVVALGANKEAILSRIKLPANVSSHYVASWREGIAASIRSGVAALQSVAPSLTHILIMLADQPALTISDYTQLLAASRNNLQNIICARYGQKNAVPAVFPACYFPLLIKLQGDKGAGKALNSKKLVEHIISVDMTKGLEDIDTQNDLTRYQEKHIKNN